MFIGKKSHFAILMCVIMVMGTVSIAPLTTGVEDILLDLDSQSLNDKLGAQFLDNFDNETEGACPPANWNPDGTFIPDRLEVDDVRSHSAPHSLWFRSQSGTSAICYSDDVGLINDDSLLEQWLYLSGDAPAYYTFFTQTAAQSYVDGDVAVVIAFDDAIGTLSGTPRGIAFHDGSDYVYTGSTWSINTWFKLGLEHDFAGNTFDLRINDFLIQNDGDFKHDQSSIRSIGYYVRSGSYSMWVDDVEIGGEGVTGTPQIFGIDMWNQVDPGMTSLLNTEVDVDNTYTFFIEGNYTAGGADLWWSDAEVELTAWFDNGIVGAGSSVPDPSFSVDDRRTQQFRFTFNPYLNITNVIYPTGAPFEFTFHSAYADPTTFAGDRHRLYINVTFEDQTFVADGDYFASGPAIDILDINLALNDPNSWDFNYSIYDVGTPSIREEAYEEFGINPDVSIAAFGNPSGSVPPGAAYAILSAGSTIVYSANTQYWVNVSVPDLLLNGVGPQSITASNIEVLNANEGNTSESDIGSWTSFPGAGNELCVWGHASPPVPLSPTLNGTQSAGLGVSDFTWITYGVYPDVTTLWWRVSVPPVPEGVYWATVTFTIESLDGSVAIDTSTQIRVNSVFPHIFDIDMWDQNLGLGAPSLLNTEVEYDNTYTFFIEGNFTLGGADYWNDIEIELTAWYDQGNVMMASIPPDTSWTSPTERHRQFRLYYNVWTQSVWMDYPTGAPFEFNIHSSWADPNTYGGPGDYWHRVYINVTFSDLVQLADGSGFVNGAAMDIHDINMALNDPFSWDFNFTIYDSSFPNAYEQAFEEFGIINSSSGGDPDIWVDPLSFDFTVEQGQIDTDILTVGNNGTSILYYNITCDGTVNVTVDPIAHWALDETSGATAYDSIGSLNGNIIGASINQPGEIGTSYYFDGSSDHVAVDHDPAIDFSSGEDFSIYAWVNTTSKNYGRILEKREFPGDTAGYMLGIWNDGTLYAGLDFGTWSAVVRGAVDIADGTWHHVGMTKYGNTLEAFVDGVSIGTNTSASGDFSNTDILYIGTDCGVYWDFAGYIDDVRIYDEVVSPSEVYRTPNQIYLFFNPGHEAKPKPLSLIFLDNFDNETLGTSPPANWNFDSVFLPDNLEVDNSQSHSSPHSMWLRSQVGTSAYCHSDDIGLVDDSSPVEQWLFIPSDAGYFSLHTQVTSSDVTAGNKVVQIGFDDGAGTITGTPRAITYYTGVSHINTGATWTTNTWFRITIEHDFTNHLFDLWKDGLMIQDDGVFVNDHDSMRAICYYAVAGFNSMWVDDVVVGEIPTGPNWLSVIPDTGILLPTEMTNHTVNVDTTGLDPGFYQKNITIESNDPDENPIVIPVNLTVTTSGQPEIEITKTAPATANPGEMITYTITYQNIGSDWAYNVVITETYPPGVTFISSIPAPDVPTNNVWSIGDVAPGGSGVIMVTVMVDPSISIGTILVNNATVDYEDGNSTYQNWDTASTLIVGPQMMINKWAPPTANTSDIITYWLNWSNTGTDWAYNASITETYPAGVNYISAIPAPTVGNNIWILGAVAPGASGSIQITVQVDPGASGVLVNYVELDYENGAGIPQMPVNDTATTFIGIGPVHNIDTDEYFIQIQEAIDDPDTQNGHTIEVGAGTYFENIVVNKILTLIGEDRNTTIIDGNGAGDVVYVISDWVNITGFTIIGGSAGGDVGLLLDNVKYCLIEDNIFTGNNVAICLINTNNNTILSNNVTSSIWYGINLAGSVNEFVAYNTVSNTPDAIKLEGADYNVVVDNNCTPNNNNGIVLDDSNNNTINNNSVTVLVTIFGTTATHQAAIIGQTITVQICSQVQTKTFQEAMELVTHHTPILKEALGLRTTTH